MRIIEYKTVLDENKCNTLVKENGRNVSGLTSANSPSSIYNICKELYNAPNLAEEYMWLMALNTKSRPIGIFELSHGTVNESIASVRDIFVKLCLCGATSFVLIHNHPSGDCEPSTQDCYVTKKVSKAAEIMGIIFNDHIIIAEDAYYSFREKGMI